MENRYEWCLIILFLIYICLLRGAIFTVIRTHYIHKNLYNTDHLQIDHDLDHLLRGAIVSRTHHAVWARQQEALSPGKPDILIGGAIFKQP